MKKLLLVLFLASFYHWSAQAQTEGVYFTTHPTLSPDAKTLIFAFEGDLWKTDLQSNQTLRITAMTGNEINPRISPNGQWLAFSNSQFGTSDVYVMPLMGGNIQQLTFHETAEDVESWSWDSQFIYFSSGANNDFTAYKINRQGGTPIRLFEHFFNRIHNVFENPVSEEIFFNDTWESKNFAHRKGYKGEYNPDIQSFNPKTKEYKQYTNYNGKDFWASIDKNGKIYFVSDEANGEYNLYSFENNQKTRLTQFNTSIKRPFVSANGEKVVFEKDYQIFVYDVKNKTSQKVNLGLIRNYVLPKEQDFQVKNNITAFDVAPDNKKLTFVSRGELFVSDIEGKFIQKLNTQPLGRVLEVKWLADSRTLLFNQTVNGYQNWFSIDADGKSSEKQHTSDRQNNRDLTLNKDRSQAVYISGRNEVRVMDLKSFASKTIAKDELWGFQNATPYFSPNSEYVVFCAKRNFEDDILVHNLKTNQTLNLTNTGVAETQPFWSPDGLYLYFISNRTKPSYPFGLQNPRIYRMPLEKLDEPFKSDKFQDLFKKEEKKEEKKDKDKDKTEKKVEEPSKSISIDTEDLALRWEMIGPDFGSQFSPYIVQKGEKTSVLFSSNHGEGKFALWKTVIEPFNPPKTEKIEGGQAWDEIAEADGKYYVSFGGNIYKLNLDGNKTDKIDISHTFRRNLSSEFNQMFQEAWANLEENFYNETFHGTDWQAMNKKYSQFLPYANSRSDLRVLLNDMLGELNSSHLGFNSNGTEEESFYKTRTQATGIIFENEKPYQVKYVVKGSPADKKDKDIRAGDVLTMVNGEKIDTKQNRDFYFQKPSLDSEIELTFEREGKTHLVKIHPVNNFIINGLLYDEWINQNQKIVDSKTNKRVAYHCMKNMGTGELDKFSIDMVSEAYKRDALILDLRYNTGGNVHDEVLKFLTQKPYLQWKYREGQLTTQSNFGLANKPIVLLINEQSLSDAEMTAAGFKELKLGKIIGTETYRWIIFTSGKGLVDGSFYRIPAWGCYTLDGKNIEKEGVKPDIYIKTTFKDRLEGKDPQLDRAIAEILKGL